MELIQEQGLCVSCWQQGSVFSSHRVTFTYICFHQQISGCLKDPVTLPAFRSPSLSPETGKQLMGTITD